MLTADYISTAEAARIKKVSQRTIERWITSGKLNAKILDPKASRVTYVIARADLERMGKTQKH